MNGLDDRGHPRSSTDIPGLPVQSLDSPLVSICIPTWCGGKFLETAIESVLLQSLGNFELIIIDDASPDDTQTRVSPYLSDPRVRYLRNAENLGAQENWNRCLREARGGYIKLLPHDDSLEPDCLQKQVAALERHPHLVLAFSGRRIIDSRDRQLFIKRPPWKTGAVRAQDLLRRCIRAGTNLIGEPGAVLFRRSTANVVGSFDASLPFVLDLDYWSRLLAHGDAWCEKSALASFRISTASWSVAIGKRQSSEFESFIDRISQAPHILPTATDRLIGRLAARGNSALRRAIYALTISKTY